MMALKSERGHACRIDECLRSAVGRSGCWRREQCGGCTCVARRSGRRRQVEGLVLRRPLLLRLLWRHRHLRSKRWRTALEWHATLEGRTLARRAAHHGSTHARSWSKRSNPERLLRRTTGIGMKRWRTTHRTRGTRQATCSRWRRRQEGDAVGDRCSTTTVGRGKSSGILCIITAHILLVLATAIMLLATTLTVEVEVHIAVVAQVLRHGDDDGRPSEHASRPKARDESTTERWEEKSGANGKRRCEGAN